MPIDEPGAESAVETQDYEVFSETQEPEKPAEVAPKEEPAKADESEEDHSEDKPRKKGGFQKKIERQEAELAQLRAELAAKTAAPSQKQDSPSKSDDAPVKPKADDFQTYQDYENAKDDYFDQLADWKAEQKVKAAFETRDKQSQEQKAKAEYENSQKTYQEKAIEFSKQTPDFDKVIQDFAEEHPVTPAMISAVQSSDMGPEVAYYIAKNPDLAEKMADMNILQLNKEVGKIEAKLEMQKSPSAAVKTKSPPPISPVKNSGKTDTAMRDDEPYEDWVKKREASLRR